MAATLNTGAVTVTSTATLIKAANTARQAMVIQNLGPSADIYVGTATVTVATGLRIAVNDALDGIVFTGAIYGITASGSSDVRFFEEAT